jgi:hypothetical protein
MRARNRGSCMGWLLLLYNSLRTAALVQATARYKYVSTVQLSLLWCTMSRLTWLMIILLYVIHSEGRHYTLFSLLSWQR